jgi:hypothetical protein
VAGRWRCCGSAATARPRRERLRAPAARNAPTVARAGAGSRPRPHRDAARRASDTDRGGAGAPWHRVVLLVARKPRDRRGSEWLFGRGVPVGIYHHETA